jgi:hypothetical protein
MVSISGGQMLQIIIYKQEQGAGQLCTSDCKRMKNSKSQNLN